MIRHAWPLFVLLISGCGGGGAEDPRVGNAVNVLAPSGGQNTFEAKFSTFIGGSEYERVQGVFVDGEGYIYLAGTTHSSDFPATPGSFQDGKPSPPGGAYDDSDGFVAKLSPGAESIIWATYLGGSKRDSAYGIRLDSAGNVYVSGATGSPDFPTSVGAYDETANGPYGESRLTDMFVAKFDGNGKLLFSTIVGGDSGVPGGDENPRGAILVDEERGRIYVAGLANTDGFPTTPGAFQTRFNGGAGDAVVFALSIDGSRLIASSYFGGSGSDIAPTSIEQHPDGSIYIAGATNSKDFPITPGVFQPKLASGDPAENWTTDSDAFVARLSPDLDKVIFSTYLGGNGQDAVSHNQGFAMDGQGRPVVMVNTQSTDFPVASNAFAAGSSGEMDGAVVILSADGKRLEAGTYIGGSGFEEFSGITVGPFGRVYISGQTPSKDFPVTADAFQTAYGGGGVDMFFSVFSPDLSSLEYSTFIGGTGEGTWHERGRTVWLNDNGDIVLGGVTDSPDFPVFGISLQKTYGGAQDGILFGFGLQVNE